MYRTKIKIPAFKIDPAIPVRDIILVLVSVSFFFSLVPFYIAGKEWFIRLNFITGFVAALALVNYRVSRNRLVYALVYTVIMVLIYLPRHEKSPPFNYYLIMIVPVLFWDDRVIAQAFKIFSRIFAFLLIPAILLNILFMLGIEPTLKISDFSVENKLASGFYYVHWMGSLLIAPSCFETRFPRLTGFLDEPGYTATLSFFLLLGDDFRIKKWNNMILFIAGIFSLSIAFLVLLFLYLVFKASWKNKLLIVLLLLLVFSFVKDEPYIEKKVKGRIEEFVRGENNRIGSEKYTMTLDKQMRSGLKWFGKGYLSARLFRAENESFNTSHWTQWLLDFGIIGTLVLVFFYLFTGFYFNPKLSGIFFTAMFLLSVYQRPLIFHAFYFLILIGGLLNLKIITKDKSGLIT